MSTVRPHRIDTHHHVVPPICARWLREQGVRSVGSRPLPTWDVDGALEAMETLRVATAVPSVSTPGVDPGTGREARRMARAVDGFAAAVAAERPDRFDSFATLTLPDVEGAVAEVHHALGQLGADGVVLPGNHRGTYLGDPVHEPLMEAFADPTHVLFGSDWPYAETEIAARFTASLDEQPYLDHAAVDRGDTEAVLPRLAALTPVS